MVSIIGVMKSDTRCLDYSPYGDHKMETTIRV